MKSPIIFFALAGISEITSCNDPEHLLLRHDGKWNIDLETVTYTVGDTTTITSFADYGVYTFNDDGTGHVQYTNASNILFTWTLKDDLLSVTYTIDIYSGSTLTVDFDILEISKEEQHWYGEYPYNLYGTDVYYKEDIQLSSMQ